LNRDNWLVELLWKRLHQVNCSIR